MGKKFLALALTVVLLCAVPVHAFAAAPSINSSAACVMDADTGQILYEKDSLTELPIASITKVMTALLVLERGDLSAMTTATEQALNMVEPASTRVGFVPNEQVSVDTLMYCMLVDSANDAANVLASYIAGDVDSFVSMMNTRAAQLGCTHTHFANPNGLDAEGHYSCARDMALITYAANKHEEFRKYSSALKYELPPDNVIGAGWQVWTKVDMLRQESEVYDPRIYAAKTGWTTNAHNTFVACGRSENSNLIVSVLNCQVKSGIFLDTKMLLDYSNQELPATTVQPEEYAEKAKRVARHANHEIDTEVLPPFVVHLPEGFSTDELDYRCETTKFGANLIVSLKPDFQQAYTDATGVDGSQVMCRIPLTMGNQTEILPLSEVLNKEYPQVQNKSWIDNLLDRLPEWARILVTIGAFIVGAIVLLIILLFLLGLYRRTRKRRKRKKNKETK